MYLSLEKLLSIFCPPTLLGAIVPYLNTFYCSSSDWWFAKFAFTSTMGNKWKVVAVMPKCSMRKRALWLFIQSTGSGSKFMIRWSGMSQNGHRTSSKSGRQSGLDISHKQDFLLDLDLNPRSGPVWTWTGPKFQSCAYQKKSGSISF